MSINRDIDLDQAATRAVLAGHRSPLEGDFNWLGHKNGSGAAKIDEMLISGATKVQMATARGAVDTHLHHLKTVHGLSFAAIGDIWMFDRSSLGK